MEEIKIADFVFNAEVYRGKKVRKCTPTSGAIYLHKSLIGKTFDLILIQKEPKEEPKVEPEEETKRLEESLQKIKEL